MLAICPFEPLPKATFHNSGRLPQPTHVMLVEILGNVAIQIGCYADKIAPSGSADDLVYLKYHDLVHWELIGSISYTMLLAK